MTDLVKVYTISGGDAEIYRLFLESLGFEVMIVQESIGKIFTLTIGSLGEIHIYARPEDAEKITEALQNLEDGAYDIIASEPDFHPLQNGSDTTGGTTADPSS